MTARSVYRRVVISSNSFALQVTTACGVYGRVVISYQRYKYNDDLSERLPVINDTTDLSEELPVINNTTNLSEGLSIINNTSTMTT